MIFGTIGLLALLTAAVAHTNPLVSLAGRDDDPSSSDLLSSCPGGPGSSDLEKADRCTLINSTSNPNIRVWKPLGNPQLNCAGATDPVTVTLGGQTTISQIIKADSLDASLNLNGITLLQGLQTSPDTTASLSSTVSYEIRPGKQAVYAIGAAMQSMNGTIQVNYGSTQFGHYIWYIFDITQMVPIPGNVQFQPVESDCGADPNDLSRLNTTVLS